MKRILKIMIFALLLTAMSVGAQETIRVNYSGDRPTICDFVTALLSQNEFDDDESLRFVAGEWEARRKGSKLRDGASFTIDERNGYVRYDIHLDTDPADGSTSQHSWWEFCYWNYADGKGKLVGVYAGLEIDGVPTDTELTGITFYRYDNATRQLTFAYNTELGFEVSVPEGASHVSFALPRTGKDIVATARYADGRQLRRLMKWNGHGFTDSGYSELESAASIRPTGSLYAEQER